MKETWVFSDLIQFLLLYATWLTESSSVLSLNTWTLYTYEKSKIYIPVRWIRNSWNLKSTWKKRYCIAIKSLSSSFIKEKYFPIYWDRFLQRSFLCICSEVRYYTYESHHDNNSQLFARNLVDFKISLLNYKIVKNVVRRLRFNVLAIWHKTADSLN